ncbi:hypothetical protein EGI22_06615 [Lacihabitans sp. LS3-19]|uniref:hypothetical protein n=1 Tax=Lacihabitans sp. LS3-19 TaxID=2487335 RepID=UPI0020CEB8E1|nr:hypothetical protein [Lacihabitans sp. LS3-19]MCP9767578.1 hypothetical protein [Lacihabitans sp. LS3-19]
MKKYFARIFFLTSISFLVFNCSKSSGDVAPENEIVTIGGEKMEFADKGTITNVVKQANTTEISLSDMKSLDSFDNAKLVFSGSPASVKALKNGQVVLFEGNSLRKITSITESGGKTTVNTTNAKFNQYYKTAKVNFEKQMYWTSSNIKNAKIKVAGGRLKSISGANDVGLEYSGELAGWKLNLKLNPESGEGRKLNVELTAKRGSAAGIEVKGFISDFSATSDIDLNNGNLDSYNHQHNNLNGELEVKYAFLSLDQIAQISIPLEISRTILVNGVIPVTFTLKCNLKVYPEIIENSTCQAHLKLTYNGTQGFNYSNRSIETAGTLAGFDVTRIGDTGSASAGVVGVGVGLEFPRFQIGIFHSVVVPYILNNTSVQSYFESGLPFVPGPCNQTTLGLKGVVGVDLSFFGASFSGSRDLYERKTEFKTPGSKCPSAFINPSLYSVTL